MKYLLRLSTAVHLKPVIALCVRGSPLAVEMVHKWIPTNTLGCHIPIFA